MNHPDVQHPLTHLLSAALGPRTAPEGPASCVFCRQSVAPGNMAHLPGELPDVYGHATCLMWRSSSAVEMPEIES